MKAQFSPQVIGELRHRVISFNEAVYAASRNASREAPQETPLMKLGILKGLYKRWYGGRGDPHQHALQKIDEHLQTALAKAAEDEPRDARGRWKAGIKAEVYAGRGRAKPIGGMAAAGAGGSEPPGGQAGFYRDVAKPRDHAALARENAGYDAAQTQVIPETRYSVFGPPLAGAAMVGLGIDTGARGEWSGSIIDRAQTRLAGAIGEKAGQITGQAVTAPIRGAALATRGVVGGINRLAHTTYRRPHPDTGKAAMHSAAIAGQKAGRFVGEKLSQAQVLAFSGPGIGARKLAAKALGNGLKGRIGARVIGGTVGGLVMGALAAPGAYHLASSIGPYLDTLFPRHVRKMDAILFDAPEVLAKQAELMNDDLAKANIGAALRAVSAATRRFGGKAANRIVATLRPSIASHTVGPGVVSAPTSIGGAAAHTVFGTHGALPPKPGQFTVGRNIAGRSIRVGQYAVPLGMLGAGAGAISGAAGVGAHDYLFASKHPRDPKGRWASKAKAAKLGAKVGGAVGLGFGVVAGLAAARRGHSALLTNALARLGAAAPAMFTETETLARTEHAKAFVANKANQAKIRQFAPGEDVTHSKVEESLKGHAKSVWENTAGRALRQGPEQWYTSQLDDAFDKSAFRQMRNLAETKTQPLIDKRTGKPMTPVNAKDLQQHLDLDKLTPGQRTIWDDHLQRRNDAVGTLQGIYETRRAAVANTETKITTTKAELDTVSTKLENIGDDLEVLVQNDAPFQTLRSFARSNFGHQLQARTKVDALNEIKTHMAEVWLPDMRARESRLEREIKGLEQEIGAARLAPGQDIKLDDATEAMAVKNPFDPGGNARTARPFLQPMPDAATARAAAETEGARPFLHASQQEADSAKAYLTGLIAAQEAALKARVPTSGLIERGFAHIAPKFSAAMHAAWAEAQAVSAADRAAMTGTQAQISAIIQANKNPKTFATTVGKMKNDAYSYGKATGKFLLANWKSVSNIVGLAGLVGAADISAPPGKRVRWNPKTWTLPQGLKHEIEWPNPITKPNEALLGVSYRDKQGQQRFLHGIHITTADGAHSMIPLGAAVETTKQQLRNQSSGGGGGGNPANRAPALTLNDPKAVEQAIIRMKGSGQITDVGTPDARFAQRVNGNAGTPATDVADAYWKTHVAYLAGLNKPHEDLNDGGRYWRAFDGLFRDSTQLLDNTQRAELLVGNGQRRGVLGNPGKVYQSNDTNRIVNQLVKQITVHGGAGDEAKFRSLKRMAFVLGVHFKLTDPQVDRIYQAIDKSYTNATSKQPPGVQAKPATAGSRVRTSEVEQLGLTALPSHMRSAAFPDDQAVQTAAADVYRREVSRLRTLVPTGSEADEEDIHSLAQAEAISNLHNMNKSAPADEGLRKFLASGPPKQRRAPGSDGLGAVSRGSARLGAAPPPIMGAAGKAPGPPAIKLPSSPSAGTKPPAIGGARNLATRLDASHQLSQGASYGLSQGAWEGTSALATRFLPGGGAIGATLRTLIPSVASYVGGVSYGPGLGAKLGRKLGDTTDLAGGRSAQAARSDSESNVRSAGGIAAQLGVQHASHLAAKVGLRALPGALGRQIASVPGKIGGAALRTFGMRAAVSEGATEGATIGSALGPVGTVAGIALGAGAGWLADEGIGMLYRHLNHYGSHVPKMAAKTLGHHQA